MSISVRNAALPKSVAPAANTAQGNTAPAPKGNAPASAGDSCS